MPFDYAQGTKKLCPMPYAPCPMPNSPCPIPHAQFPMPNSLISHLTEPPQIQNIAHIFDLHTSALELFFILDIHAQVN